MQRHVRGWSGPHILRSLLSFCFSAVLTPFSNSDSQMCDEMITVTKKLAKVKYLNFSTILFSEGINWGATFGVNVVAMY